MIFPSRLFLLFLSFLSYSISATTVKTISADLDRHLKKGSTEQSISGHIYYTDKKSILVINKPLSQWMIFENNRMIIYYPAEKNAIRIISRDPLSMPFFQTFIGPATDNFGLAAKGYSISWNEMKQDTLFIHWKPPRETKMLGEFTVMLQKNRLVSTEQKASDGQVISRSFFAAHIRHGNSFFPRSVTSMIFSGKDTVVIESITYSNIVFDRTLPDTILEFSLPVRTMVKDIEW
ncbi:MAG: hypothetical protein Q8898_15725 [Bacillota bacterium]|nr:hypothetical protein [Bacillota bacterium]